MMYHMSIRLIRLFIVIFAVSAGYSCRSKTDVLSDYTAESATIHQEIDNSRQITFNTEKSKNYNIIRNDMFPETTLGGARIISRILRTNGISVNESDTVFCIVNTPEICPNCSYRYILKTVRDSVVIEWRNRMGPFDPTEPPTLHKLQDYIDGLARYGDKTKNSYSVYLRTVFDWDVDKIKSMLIKSGIPTDSDHVKAIRIILDNGHIADYECFEFIEPMYFSE